MSLVWKYTELIKYVPGPGHSVASRDLFTMKKLFLRIVVKQKDCFWSVE